MLTQLATFRSSYSIETWRGRNSFRHKNIKLIIGSSAASNNDKASQIIDVEFRSDDRIHCQSVKLRVFN